jgi:hypothetical protein
MFEMLFVIFVIWAVIELIALRNENRKKNIKDY